MGEGFTVQEYVADGASVKVIDTEEPIYQRSQLSEILEAFYIAERAHQPSAHKPTKALMCKHSSAILNRLDCFCSKCLADEVLTETVWCEVLGREVCPRCNCESCEHWRGEEG